MLGTYVWLWTGRVSLLAAGAAGAQGGGEAAPCAGETPLSATEAVTVYTAATGVASSCDLSASVWEPAESALYWEELRQRPVILPRILVPELCEAVSAIAADDAETEAFSAALDGSACRGGVPDFSGCTDTIFSSTAACVAAASANRTVVPFGAGALSTQQRYWGGWRPPPHLLVRGKGVVSQPARLAGVRDAFVSVRATHGAGYAADAQAAYAGEELSSVVAACRSGAVEFACPWVKGELVMSAVRSWGGAIFHFHLEVLPSLIPFLEQALEWDTRPVSLHLAGTSPYVQRWFDLFGWSSHLQIHTNQAVFAEEAVLVDTAGGSPLADAPLLDNLRRAVFTASFAGHPPSPGRIVLIVRRSATGDNGPRGGDNLPFQQVLDALDRSLPSFWRFEIFDDADARLMSCIACQVDLFARASVIVGTVGAGMTNLLYAPPNSQVLLLNGPSTHGLPPYLELAALRSLAVTVLPIPEPPLSIHPLIAHIVAATKTIDENWVGGGEEEEGVV